MVDGDEAPSESPQNTLKPAERRSFMRAHQGKIPDYNYDCFRVACMFLRSFVYTRLPWPTEIVRTRMVSKAWDRAKAHRREEFRANGFAMELLCESNEPDRVTAGLVNNFPTL
jgi:hypothetical protein